MRFYVTYAYPIISCSKCGHTQEAHLMSIGQWCWSGEEVEALVKSKMPDIPVGWSSNGYQSNGKRDLRCTLCTTNQKRTV
jgi:hypothetical protein